MELDDLRQHWEVFGQTDPLWAVLTSPDKRHGKWNLDDFFHSGEVEIDRVLARVRDALATQRVDISTRDALDFGCGVGRLTQALAESYDSVLGIDIAPSMVHLAKEYNKKPNKCHYEVANGNDLSQLSTSSFDFVYTAHVLQHMEQRFAKAYVREFMRVLRPGGVAVIEVPSERVVGRRDPLPEGAFKAAISLATPTGAATCGKALSLDVRVMNTGDTLWPALGDNGWFQVALGNHWMSEDGQIVLIQDDGRAVLPRDLPPRTDPRHEPRGFSADGGRYLSTRA